VTVNNELQVILVPVHKAIKCLVFWFTKWLGTWPIDWKSLDKNNNADVCGEYWPGTEPLSEPENKALNGFVDRNKNDLKFIINCHTSGNDFVWPFNGRDPNDIDSRTPGYLAIFNDIAKNAQFPDGVMFGNSQ
jgi:hypothetical protein